LFHGKFLDENVTFNPWRKEKKASIKLIIQIPYTCPDLQDRTPTKTQRIFFKLNATVFAY